MPSMAQNTKTLSVVEGHCTSILLCEEGYG